MQTRSWIHTRHLFCLNIRLGICFGEALKLLSDNNTMELIAMVEFVNIADLRDPGDSAGRSYRQVNAELLHTIPIGSLVELESGERLYVAQHGRDCDMTPLYTLTMRDYLDEPNELIRRARYFGGYGEESLTVIRLPLSANYSEVEK